MRVEHTVVGTLVTSVAFVQEASGLQDREVYVAVLVRGIWPANADLIRMARGFLNTSYGGVVNRTQYPAIREVYVYNGRASSGDRTISGNMRRQRGANET